MKSVSRNVILSKTTIIPISIFLRFYLKKRRQVAKSCTEKMEDTGQKFGFLFYQHIINTL